MKILEKSPFVNFEFEKKCFHCGTTQKVKYYNLYYKKITTRGYHNESDIIKSSFFVCTSCKKENEITIKKTCNSFSYWKKFKSFPDVLINNTIQSIKWSRI